VVSARVLAVGEAEKQEGVTATLEGAGHRVREVDSKAEALDELRNHSTDAVVTTYDLPEEDGIELLRAVRSDYGTVPVIIYAFDGDEQVASDAIDASVTAYIPANGDESAQRLLDRIEESAITTTQNADDDVPSPSAETIIRAVDEAPVGITISDPSLPDNPIIYMNDAYEELTGYSREDVLGRNCRFLQGPDTEEEPVAEMRQAIDEKEAVSVEVLNYREDGTPFWNNVTIAPLFEGGELQYYVGFQNDVTDRKEAEAIAQQRARSLREERQALERVLGRVSGLINEISRILVNASDREEIERGVCAEIAATEGYSHAWIGEPRPAGVGLSVRAGAEGTQMAEMTANADWTGTVFDEALEGGSVEVRSAAEELPAGVSPSHVGASSMAVVPLTYRRATYGVLTVYAEESGVLDRRECEVFEAIGQMVASGINAVETKQVLTSDRVTELGFEITDGRFPLIELASVVDGGVTYTGSTSDGGESMRMFVTITDPGTAFEEIVEQCSSIADGFVVAERDGKLAASIELEEPKAFDELAEYGATLRDLSVSESSGTAQLHVELPVDGDVRSVLSVLESAYDGVNLVRQRERKRDPRPTAEFVASVADRLTDRQYTALETAYLSDYFEFPRPVSGEDLAKSMDISRQTYHQHLRAAQRKLIEEFFETE
jgi:PAS domain S-box-containing protein